jgi:DMSO/TMAO reductase YedYZ molybdopterin-dependent catalytic subunit
MNPRRMATPPICRWKILPPRTPPLVHSWSGKPLTPEHGGPVRLVVPHLYFWKSAKWLQAIEFLPARAPGYWEVCGYHSRGDPWAEQRYSDD